MFTFILPLLDVTNSSKETLEALLLQNKWIILLQYWSIAIPSGESTEDITSFLLLAYPNININKKSSKQTIVLGPWICRLHVLTSEK